MHPFTNFSFYSLLCSFFPAFLLLYAIVLACVTAICCCCYCYSYCVTVRNGHSCSLAAACSGGWGGDKVAAATEMQTATDMMTVSATVQSKKPTKWDLGV